MQDTPRVVIPFSVSAAALSWEVGSLVPLDALWRSLVSGRLRIRRSHCGAGLCFAALGNQAVREVPSALAVRVAQRVLSGEQPKVIASEYSISQATICHYCRVVLDTFSDNTTVSRAPTFAVMCACAAQGLPIDAIVDWIDPGGDALLRVELPDALLERADLSPAERSIAWARIQGKSAAEICADRKTSPRTIANQLNAIHRKLRVSGRCELLAAALTYNAEHGGGPRSGIQESLAQTSVAAAV